MMEPETLDGVPSPAVLADADADPAAEEVAAEEEDAAEEEEDDPPSAGQDRS